MNACTYIKKNLILTAETETVLPVTISSNIRWDESNCNGEPPKTNSYYLRAGQSVQEQNLPDE